jgi:membrane-associated phospholipid phosphatase
MLFASTSVHATIWEDFTLPIHNEDSQKVLIFGGGAVLLAAAFKQSLGKRIQRELKEDQPLCCHITRSGNTFLQIFPNIIYSFGFGISYLFSDNETSKLRAIGMAKATLYSGIVTDVLKPIIREQRPNGTSNNSFPSGHSTTAFAFASFVASEHPWYIGVPAYTMATFVGFCRMHDNHHYLHDVLAGATIGISYGIAHSQNLKKNESSNSALFMAPTEDMKGMAMKYSMQF